MAQTISITKSFSYDSSRLKTPSVKKTSSSLTYDRSKDLLPSVPIIMDEYGQTPDHYYLARKPPPPPSFLRVKRKLDLQSSKAPKVDDYKSNQSKRRKRLDCVPKNTKYTEKQRYDTSLGQLTKKFLKLMSDAIDGVINLNTASALLSVPKRRLYDITNVLEGAGLIQKTARNNIQWMGRSSSPCASVVKYDLETEIDILHAKENKLDELIYNMKSEINLIKDADAKYHYVTGNDLQSIEEFSNKMLIGIKTSPSFQLVEKKERTLLVSTKSAEIEAYLLYEDCSFTNILHPEPDPEYKENSCAIKVENQGASVDSSISDSCTDVSHLRKSPCKVSNSPFKGPNSPFRGPNSPFKGPNSPFKGPKSPFKGPSIQFKGSNSPSKGSSNVAYPSAYSGAMWSEANTVIKNAFISEEDDIAPMGKHFLLQTEDQDLESLPYSLLESPADSYYFSLDDGEGLTDLFDCTFSCP